MAKYFVYSEDGHVSHVRNEKGEAVPATVIDFDREERNVCPVCSTPWEEVEGEGLDLVCRLCGYDSGVVAGDQGHQERAINAWHDLHVAPDLDPEDEATKGSDELPKIRNYGEYSNDNYGAHSLYVDLGTLGLYYSYDTIVAFHDGSGLVCSENVWGKTTGKHLNWIQRDHKARVPNAEFDRLLALAIAKHIT